MFTSPYGVRKVQVHFDLEKEPSLTEQQHKSECCIRSIVKSYMRDGVVTHINPMYSNALYGDFSELPDFQTAQNIVISAQNDFMALPVDVRKFFDHDPAKMIEFCQDEKNYDKAVAIGLIAATPKVTNVTAGVAEAAPAGAANP